MREYQCVVPATDSHDDCDPVLPTLRSTVLPHNASLFVWWKIGGVIVGTAICPGDTAQHLSRLSNDGQVREFPRAMRKLRCHRS
jgi:hypothetical protein